MELTETGDISERAEAEGEGDSQSLMKNFLEDATATDNDDQPVSVDAPDAREPALDTWEEKEKPDSTSRRSWQHEN
jgi:hypothetical protein